MGASLAMEYTLRLSYPIAGIIAIAGFIKDKDQLASDATLESRKTPILILINYVVLLRKNLELKLRILKVSIL